MITLIPIPTEELDSVEILISDLITRGVEIDEGRSREEDVIESIRSGGSQLWMLWSDHVEAIIITEVVDYPKFKACQIQLCVGENKKAWVHKIREIEKWAKSIGCSKMEIPFARQGWARVLPEYKKKRIVLTRTL